MRRRRFLGSREEGAVYHVISRVVNGERLFDPETREVLRRSLDRAAGFSGVRVLTFALLSNHFHLLVHIPPPAPVPDGELVRRFRLLYPEPTPHEPMSPQALATLLAAGGARADAVRRRLTRRMGDLSEFAKTLKQRFAMWLNRHRQRFGPLWSDRFRSLLVQECDHALRTVAAYIDLNPVRAGLADDPKDYRWCGYHEAVVGQPDARHGLAAILGCLSDPPPNRSRARELLRAYREILFSTGEHAPPGQAAIPAEDVQAVLRAGGHLPLATVARLRLRHLTTGLAFGDPEWARAQIDRVPPTTPTSAPRPQHPHPFPGAPTHLAVLIRPRAAAAV